MSLKFAKGTIKDKSGNLSDATTITIGKNEPGGSDTDKTVVDIVDPVWTLGDVDTNDGTIKLRVKDKFLIKDRSKFELTTDKTQYMQRCSFYRNRETNIRPSRDKSK